MEWFKLHTSCVPFKLHTSYVSFELMIEKVCYSGVSDYSCVDPQSLPDKDLWAKVEQNNGNLNNIGFHQEFACTSLIRLNTT